ncbi:FecR family protein [Methylobacterium radiodurans]|uniref:FecR family protein n=1 Tax=Methylobacterium radiodurans TaxID=2202828 RepID=UPI0019514726|nr:FecR family protein [Methylobacterium radiodurans]
MGASDTSGASGEDCEDPVYEASAGWVARLSSPDATSSDRQAFEVWRSADPSHGAAYAEMDALWRKLGHVPDPRQRRRLPKGLAGLAALALSGAALAYQFGLVDRARADLWSGVGEITHATLADGSRIDLNTDTALALRFTESGREVEILRGEAFFEVAPDPRRPFVVYGNGLRARALGTRFSVRVDGVERPVDVAEGRVEVTASGRQVQVSAGEAAQLATGSSLSVVKADVGRTTAWREGRIVFAGERLSAVLAELGRYRRGRIVLLDPAAGERRVTGAFDPHNTDDALNAIAATMGVRVTRLTPFLTLVGSPP